MKKILALFSICIFVYILSRAHILYINPMRKLSVGGLNSYDVILTKNEKFHLYVIQINKRVSYESENIRIATVNLNGSIRAWQAGTTMIRVRYDHKVLRCRVKVIALNHESLKLKVGQKKYLRVQNTINGVKYQSSDKNVASVDRYGKIKAKKKGTAVITATYKKKKMTCKVTVR